MEVTDVAKTALLRTIDAGDVKDGKTLRMISNEGKATVKVDDPKEGDTVFYKDDRAVLSVAPELSCRFEDKVIDIEGRDERPHLVARPKKS